MLTKREDGVVEGYLYGEIGRRMDIDADKLIEEIEDYRREGCKEFTFYVNSDGGDVLQGSHLYAYLDRTDIAVTWVIDGVAASMMAVLLCNKKHKVVASKYSKLMYHRVQGYVYGNSDEIRSLADMVDKFEGSLVEMMASRLGMEAEAVRATYFSGSTDHWLTATEARELGLVDEIINEEVEMPEPDDLKNPRMVVDYYRAKIMNLSNNQKQDKMKVESVAAVLGIKDNAGDEAHVISRLNDVVAENKAMSDQLAALKAENEKMKKELEKQQEQRVVDMVDRAIAENRIGADQRETYLKLGHADYESTKAVLDNKQAPVRVVDKLGDGKSHETTDDWDTLHKSGKLEALKKSDPQRYAQVYKEKFGREPR